MTWFKVDDSFHSHPKVMAASPAALGLWVVAGSWSGMNLTEGHVPSHVLPRLMPKAERLARELVAIGLWDRVEDGWLILRWVQTAPGARPTEVWRAERDDRRQRIAQWLRDRVLERDEHRCVLCAATDDLTLDHIYPWSKGGPDTEENLRVLCRSCNSSKGARI